MGRSSASRRCGSLPPPHKPTPTPTSLPPPHPRQVAGRQAGEVFSNSEVFNNPVAGKLIGLEPQTLPPNPRLALTCRPSPIFQPELQP